MRISFILRNKFEKYLNQFKNPISEASGSPEKYGTWLKNNKPEVFEVELYDWAESYL